MNANPTQAHKNTFYEHRQILIVDDELINREMLGFIVGQHYEPLYAENGRKALEMLRKTSVSLVMLDLMMPEMDGFAVLEAMQADDRMRRIPVIVLTSEASAEVKSLECGAMDFIKKPFDMPEMILARVSRTIELVEDRHIINTVETDTLTGLYNRDFFFEYASSMETRHPGCKMDAVVVDLDRFHLYNEMNGRLSGDAVLRRLAQAIRRELEGSIGIGCRSNGDTFFVYCEHREDHDQMLARLSDYMKDMEDGIIHLRMGVCTRTDMVQDIIGRFDRASAACNRMRGNFINSLAYYDDNLYLHDIHDQRLINEMHEAIAQRQFCVYFQPKYSIREPKPRMVSVEALIRWVHPELGMVSPGEFIPLFEKNGMIRELDTFVWQESACMVRKWHDAYDKWIPVSVNVSRIDLFDAELLTRLNSICRENGIAPDMLHLEITESAYAEDTEEAVRVITELRQSGYQVEMDDFGSGYSSLNMLIGMPVDVIKVDGGFMRAISKEKTNEWLLGILVEIARNLGVPTVFEGVEEKEQVEKIRMAGGDIVQGYYFSKPLPAEQLARLIEKEQKEEVQC